MPKILPDSRLSKLSVLLKYFSDEVNTKIFFIEKTNARLSAFKAMLINDKAFNDVNKICNKYNISEHSNNLNYLLQLMVNSRKNDEYIDPFLNEIGIESFEGVTIDNLIKTKSKSGERDEIHFKLLTNKKDSILIQSPELNRIIIDALEIRLEKFRRMYKEVIKSNNVKKVKAIKNYVGGLYIYLKENTNLTSIGDKTFSIKICNIIGDLLLSRELITIPDTYSSLHKYIRSILSRM